MPEIEVTVVCAWPERIWQRRLRLPEGSTVADALRASGCREALPELSADAKAGIFGKLAAGAQVLCDGDRVELYRPLLADPKAARRKRAAGEGD